MNCVVVLDCEGYAISFKNIVRLIEYFSYGSGRRIAIELLAVTGMRPSELDRVKPECFWMDAGTGKTHLIWQPGKNQKGHRNEIIPDWLVKEIGYYLELNYLLPHHNMFLFTHHALRDYVNKARPELGGDFLKKRPGGPKGTEYGSEYVIQLKSFRHTYACKEFYEAMEEYGKDLAIHMVGAKMKHKTAYMTARHYVSDVKTLRDELKLFRGASMGRIIKNACQRKLLEWY